METLIVAGVCFAVVIAVVWYAVKRSNTDPFGPNKTEPSKSDTAGTPGAAGPAPGSAKRPTAKKRAAQSVQLPWANVIDLRALPSTRYRIKGTSFVTSNSSRALLGGTEYHLVREPDNTHDTSAIAIYGKGRKVGYLSASKAAIHAKELDRLGADAYLVGGAGVLDHSIKLWVDVPSIVALRKFTSDSRGVEL